MNRFTNYCFFFYIRFTAVSIGFQRIEVILDHPQKVCYSGNQISGNVRLDLDEPTSALGKLPPRLSKNDISFNSEENWISMTLTVAKRKLFRPKKIFRTTLSPKKVVLVKNGRVYFEIYQIFVNKQKERERADRHWYRLQCGIEINLNGIDRQITWPENETTIVLSFAGWSCLSRYLLYCLRCIESRPCRAIDRGNAPRNKIFDWLIVTSHD